MIRIGDTPESLGSVTTANALVIDGKVFTKEQVIALQAERDEQAQRIRELERKYSKLQACGDAACFRLKEAIAERDALAAQFRGFYLALMKAENISEVSKEIISGIWLCKPSPQHHLAAHDAEVAAKAVLEFAAKLLVNQKVDAIDCAKIEADQLRTKAK